MSTLERAVAIAAEAHAGQCKRGLEPFLLHVLRVMLRFDEPDLQMTAALHDVVEKSAWTLARLRAEGFTEAVLAAVDALTERPGEARAAYLARARDNAMARQVKLADLDDNTWVTQRLPDTPAQRARLDRYRAERVFLNTPPRLVANAPRRG